MNNAHLQNLISGFSPQKLVPFLREKNRNFRPTPEKLYDLDPDQFSQGEKIGEIPFNLYEKLGVYTIRVTRNLSERTGKKYQYDLAKKVLKESDEDAGIFVFYDAEGSFRFSLVYANYLGTKRDWSTFRRFTYFVAKHLTNKTFLQRVGEGDFSSLEKIKEAFSVEKVTKEFYQEISYWYFWACQQVRFPEAAEREENGRQVAVIRLITRLIFVWFMREKGLIPGDLFNQKVTSECLTDLDDNSSSYYLAILQNLFFTTLNTPMEKRQFRSNLKGFRGHNPDFGNQYKYRHQALIAQPGRVEDFFANIPFLNGGLFDCLDNPENRDYFDGFSDTKKNQPLVPNLLFFSPGSSADLNAELGTSNQQYKVKGLFETLSSYNFTIDENTADDKEVALDPELLGRVFENLLASFNPETSTTARKATGSYYTPREIVDYMVDESIKAYLSQYLEDVYEIDKKLTWLLSHEQEGNPFANKEVKRIVNLVDKVRIVDPAVGSGAFPMGALNKLVLILQKLDPDGKLWEQAQLDGTLQIPDAQIRMDVREKIRKSFEEKNHDYGRKLHLIQKCIYGVDIQQIAVEIAKLRFFISLLVDETVEKDKDNWGIEPLPNLDFKIMQGNSLISTFEGIDLGPKGEDKPQQGGLFSSQGEKGELIRELQNRKELYQTVSDHEEKRKLQKEIDQYLLRIFKINALEQHQDYADRLTAIDRKYQSIPDEKTREKLKAIEKEKVSKEMGININVTGRDLNSYSLKQMKRDFFPWALFFVEVFAEKGGFDIILGNPPYIGEKGHKELFEAVKHANLSKHYLGKMDYFYFFFHLALDLCRPSGCVAFISTNYYPTATGAYKLRKDFYDRATINRLINFNELKIFESATGQHNMITLLSKKKGKQKEAATCITDRKGYASPEILTQIISWLDDQTQYFSVAQNKLYDDDDFQIRIQGLGGVVKNGLQSILHKIKSQGVQLGSLCNINQGIVTGADKVSNRHRQKFQIDEPIGTGIFVLNNKEIHALSLSPSETSILRPWYKNSDIEQWSTSSVSDERIIYADKRLENLVNSRLSEYLSQFSEIIEHSSSNAPYLHRPRDIQFDGPKIVAPQRSSRNTFGYNEIPWYASADVYFITQKDQSVDLKYILALLNSKVYYLWLYHRGKRKGETLELYQTPLTQVPIPKIPIKDQTPFIQVVEEILQLVNSDGYVSDKSKQQKVSLLEKSIDRKVYELLKFTDAEIEFIEGK